MEFKKEYLEAAGPSVAIAFIAYIIRTVFARKKITLTEFFLDALAAICVGVFVGNLVTIYPIPDAAQLAMVAMAGFIGPDLLAGLLAIAKAFKDSPDQFLLKYIYAVRGVKNGMDSSTEPTSDQPKLKEPKESSPAS